MKHKYRMIKATQEEIKAILAAEEERTKFETFEKCEKCKFYYPVKLDWAPTGAWNQCRSRAYKRYCSRYRKPLNIYYHSDYRGKKMITIKAEPDPHNCKFFKEKK